MASKSFSLVGIFLMLLTHACLGCDEIAQPETTTESAAQEESPAALQKYAAKAQAFWNSRKDSRSLHRQDLPRVEQELPGVSKEDTKTIREHARQLVQTKQLERARYYWQLSQRPDWRCLEHLAEAETYRKKASASREEIGMTDEAVGKMLTDYHAYMAQELWDEVRITGYDPELLSLAKKSKYLLFRETGHSADFDHDDVDSIPPLEDCLKAIDKHLKETDLKRQDIGMTNEALAEVLARESR